jgi:hypothetical protein
MYDYWHDLKGAHPGIIAELKSTLESHEMPLGKQSKKKTYSNFSQTVFVLSLIKPDGLPFNRWDYNSNEK